MQRSLALLMLAACGRIGFDDLGTISVEEARGQLSSGEVHSCAIRGDQVWCWGDGRIGQTGDGTTDVHPIPVRVANLPPATRVAAGGYHACAITGDDDVYCWGLDDFGQTGPLETEKPLRAPFEDPDADLVPGLPQPAIEISAGYQHTCALLADRTVWCWGRNNKGQLGRGTFNDQDLGFPIPEQVEGLADIVQLSLSDDSSCALAAGGTISCWGENSSGQLGDRTNESRSRPVAVDGIVATSVSIGGDHTCALVEGGKIGCWGANYRGELGVDSDQILQSDTPKFSSADGYLAISAGMYHTCAITAERSVQCWGNGEHGQLGAGTFVGSFVPRDVAISAVAAISSGTTHTCALRADGEVKCWGLGDFGQLGDGTMLERSPTLVAGVSANRIVTSIHHTCASDGTSIKCWGYNWGGQLGDGSYDDSATAKSVTPNWGAGAISDLATGDGHTCAIVAGAVWCWGANNVGQLGDGTNDYHPEPVQIGGLPTPIVQIASTEATTCALADNDEVWCWGYNEHGELGDGTTNSRNTPALVAGGFDVLVAGRTHFCAHQVAGGITCWGGNARGQIGNGTTVDALSPVSLAVTGVGLWTGAFSTCVRDGASTTCWGSNLRNVLLTSFTTELELTPVPSGLAGPTATSDDTVCRLGNGPNLECWGDNFFGQLGNGTFDSSDDPQAVTLPVAPREVVIGDAHTCVRTTDNAVYCWGENSFGQTGSGLLGRRASPNTVAFP